MSASLRWFTATTLLVACRADPPKGYERGEDAADRCVPGAEVANDGVDQDCDGADRVDVDGDGWTEGEGDCDDLDEDVHPEAEERCDGRDGDCDGALPADEADADGDGIPTCAGDCDDGDRDVFPGAQEACDGLDGDCDGEVPFDEADADTDGVPACAGDCDEGDPAVHPGADDPCDGVDQDCDGTLETDADGDGVRSCEGDVECRDVEVCDGVDDDCDGDVDEDCSVCDRAVPNDHAAIQDAIDAASTGDVVCVGAGTYVENLDFGGREISVIGVAGADATTVEAAAAYVPVVSFVSGEGAAAVLRGLTLTGGAASYGGGVEIAGASPTLVDLRVAGNVGYGVGGGVYVEDGAPTLTRVAVADNFVGYSSCGYYYGYGGGIGLVRSDAVLEDVRVEGNVAGNRGGGLYLDESDAVLLRVSVTGNTTYESNGGGLYLSASSPTLANVLIAGNTTPRGYWAPARGAGLALHAGSSPSLANVVVAANVSAEAEGGGFYVHDGSPTLTNVVVTGNSATSGGGLHVVSGAPTLSACDVWGNAPDDLVGATDPTGTDGNVSVDPAFLDAAYHLDAASPLVDAGDPAILDPDGSVSDIGLYGGPEADAWDRDGDGYAAWWRPGAYDATTSPGADCDDDDATVYPGSGC